MKFLRKLKRNYGAIIRTLNFLGIEKSEHFRVFWDILYCQVRFKCLLDEYIAFQLYKYNNRYRKKFLYMRTRRKLYSKINVNVQGCLSKFLQRQMLNVGFDRAMIMLPDCGEETFLEFVRNRSEVIIKPDAGSCGQGVQLFVYESDEQALDFFRGIQVSTLCEERICQHEQISKFNPTSVNTIRIMSLYNGENVDFLAAILRVGGKKDSVTDNMRNNGLCASIDIPTGIVNSFFCGLDHKVYAYHPVTCEQIIGFHIPNWEKVLVIVENAHKQLPDYPVLGWDVAVTEDGAEIVEFNRCPGSHIVQFIDHEAKGASLFRYIKEKKKK